MPMAVASPSTRPTRWCRSARCRTSRSIRISAARFWSSASAARSSRPSGWCRKGLSDAIVRMQDEAFDGFGAIVDAIMTQAEARLKILNKRAARDLSGVRSRHRPAMRRQRRVFRRHRQSCARLRRRSPGARGRDRDVLGSDRSARRDPVADAPRRQRGRRPRADPRDGLVRFLSRPRRRRPQRQHHARQQEGRARQYRREVAGLDRQIRLERDRGRARARREGEAEGHAVCGDAGVATSSAARCSSPPA